MNLAESLHDFLELLFWTFNLLAFQPILLAAALCCASVALCLFIQKPIGGQSWRSSYWLIFSQLLFVPAVLLVGAFFPAGTASTPPLENMAGRWLLDILFVLSFLTGAIWLYRMKGLRWLTASLLALQQLLIVGAAVIAGISVSGNWI